MSPARIVVLAKPPAYARCKSRLAASLGPGAATRLARAMFADALDVARAAADARAAGGSTCELVLAVSGEAAAYPLVLPAPVHVSQGEGDLGRRMARLVARAAADGCTRVLLLGTDAPALPAAHVAAAFARLDTHDLVLGPVPDGGFWCLGARFDGAHDAHAVLTDEIWLDGIAWERDGTGAPVRERACARGLSVGEAPTWFDVDRGDDLARLRDALAGDGARRAPRTARSLAMLAASGATHPEAVAETGPARAFVSIVVPTLDEDAALDRCLDALVSQPGPFEIVVADGGSRDDGPARAVARPDVTVCVARPGRGHQLRAGAALATGEILLFVHVDARLPAGALDEVRAALADGRHEAGAFLTRTVADPSLPNPVGPLLRLADLRSRITRHPYGDQALFVSRTAYDAVGGFGAQPLMEDYDLSLRLAARRPLARVRREVLVSGRRFQRRPLRSLLLMRLLPPLYRLGVAPERLARLYRGR